MKRSVVLLLSLAVPGLAGGMLPGVTGMTALASAAQASSLRGAFLSPADLPSGYPRQSEKVYGSWVHRMQTSMDHCTTDSVLTKSGWQQGAIETVANRAGDAYFLVCNYLTKGTGPATKVYTFDRSAFTSAPGWKRQSVASMDDGSFAASTHSGKYVLGLIEIRHGNAVLNLAQVQPAKKGAVSISLLVRLMRLMDSRLR